MDEVQRLSNQSSNTLSHRHLNLEKKKKKRFGLRHPVVFLTRKLEGVVSCLSSHKGKFHFD